jgi:hypothetical protein
MFDSINLGGVLTDGLRVIALTVPKLAAFAAILAIGWFAAVAVQKVCVAVLDRTGFDRAVERGGIRQLLARSNYDASDLVAKLCFYAILLIAVQTAFGIWGPNPVSDLIRSVVAWLPKAAIAIVLVVVAAALARAVGDVVGSALGMLSYGRLVARVASSGVLGLGIIAALNQVGVALSVTLPVLITVLATAGGILVVGAGGGLIKPMQQRWERLLERAEHEHVEDFSRAYAAGRSDTALTGWPSFDDTMEQPVMSSGGPADSRSADGRPAEAHSAEIHSTGGRSVRTSRPKPKPTP